MLATMHSCMMLKTADLRNGLSVEENSETKARGLLEEMAKAHNVEAWKALETYNVIFRDEFYGFIGKSGSPYKQMNTRFSLNYIPGTFNGQLEFLNGKEQGTIWGVQDWHTYVKNEKGLKEKKDKDIRFWVPTYQYFIELPNRIREATVVGYVGEKAIDGINCYGVMASWNTLEPQRDIDQYMLWINAETKRLVKVEYTIRDIFKFISGAAYYQNYQAYDGIILPAEMPVESNLVKDGYLHKMSIEGFTANKVSVESLLPLGE